jgi:glycine cleavage system transcriptional repressor
MPTFALSVVGRDRPGIVAAVAERLVEHGVNVEDSQMSILRGHFAMVLVLGAAEDVDLQRLRQDLQDVAERLELEAVSLSEVAGVPSLHVEPTHSVSVYGADHPGIVHAVAAALAGAGVNITDLSTRLVGEEGEPLYVMLLEVAAPQGVDPERLLDAVAREQSLSFSVRPVEASSL